jgi:O-antigen ligase
VTSLQTALVGLPKRRHFGLLGAIATGAVAFALGVTLAALVSRFGDASPAVFLAVPLVPIIVIGTLVAPVLAPIVVFATFPVGSVGVPTGVIPLQAAEFAVLAIATVIVLRRLALGQVPLPWQPPLAWALALFVWTIVALQSSIDTTLALKQIGSLLGGIIFAASILAACRSMDELRLILGAFVAVTAGIAVASLAGGVQLQPTYGAAAVGGRLQGAFDHPNQLGALCAMGTSIAVGLAFGARRPLARIAAAAAALVILTALMFTLSRGAWIGTALALLFLLVALSEVRRALMMLVIPGVLVAALVASFLPVGQTEIKVVGERARGLTALSPYDNRHEIYAEAWREMRADPITGVGPGGFPLASARAGSRTSTYAVVHAHNLFLTWGAEVGIPAVLFILGLCLSLAFAAREAGLRFRRLGRRADRAVVAGVAAGLLAILGQGVFDYVLRNAVANIATWALVGALLVCLREARSLGVSGR